MHNFPCCTICEFLICSRMSHPKIGRQRHRGDRKTRIIIMVFKVSFVIIINLFTRLWGRQTNCCKRHLEICPNESTKLFSHRNLLSLLCCRFHFSINCWFSFPFRSTNIFLEIHKNHAQMINYNIQRKNENILFDGVNLVRWWRKVGCLYACHFVFLLFLLFYCQRGMWKFLDSKKHFTPEVVLFLKFNEFKEPVEMILCVTVTSNSAFNALNITACD